MVGLREATYARVRERCSAQPPYQSPLPRTARQGTKSADVRATFTRDHYTCRYAHCRHPTVALEVLKLVSAAFPELVPYHPNWRPVDRHILYWTYSTSLEHAVSFPAGGTSSPDNLLTACYLCNDAKKHLPAELLGWTVSAPGESDWLGLTEYLAELQRVVRDLRRPPK